MNILYDGYIYEKQLAGGISRYFSRLIGGLPTEDEPEVIMPRLNGLYGLHHPKLQVYPYQRAAFWPGRVADRINRYLLDRYLERCRAAVLHPTYYALTFGRSPACYGLPYVITVHDMIHELYPELMDPDGREADKKRRAILGASAIICVSENTKQDLLKFYTISEDRITVIHHGADAAEAPMGRMAEPSPFPYYLYVGGRTAYKNFDTLLRAFSRLVTAKPSVLLRVVGSPFTDAELKNITDLKLHDHIINHGHVDDAALASLYRSSIGLVYPSLYEGFGIPLLEAMSHRTAIIAADCASIPEVVGEAAILLDDPTDADAMCEAMTSLLDNSSMRDRLIALGEQRVRHFSWQDTIEATRRVYRAVGA